MDSNNDKVESLTITPLDPQEESKIPDAQVNPATMMISVPKFQLVDGTEENVLESTNFVAPTGQSPKAAFSSIIKGERSSPDIFVPPPYTTDQQKASNSPVDNRSVAIWVKSTTTESSSPTIERSPSLPLTLFEPIIQRSRGNSTVSTICDHQQSIVSDTMTVPQISLSNDLQRSSSLPINDQYHRNANEEEEEEEKKEDISMKFLPVTESEDSEIDKNSKCVQSEEEQQQQQQIQFQGRSPTTRESSKKSSNVSFHASVSTDCHPKPSVSHRRRRTSWNTTKNKSTEFQRSQSQAVNLQPQSLHSQILRKQFRTTLSMPNGAYDPSGDTTRQSSYMSDSVFLSPSNTHSSSSRSCSHYSPHPSFLAIPSSTSNQSSNRSGTDLVSLETNSHEQLKTFSANTNEAVNEKILLDRHLRNNQMSTTSSGTPSTENLSSSSDDELSGINKKMKRLQIDNGGKKGPIDKKRDILKQLMWLLEKKPTIISRSALVNRHHSTSPKQQHQKSAPNPFVEVIKI
ncbi:unnamed protein product [Rotaria magnacalcarata]|uniref:Uncharacterized protein n=1 Tax=Rotaria magnacalcarata TaxID=392030 RepID=A0A816X9V7_9BILA|nr:unnamed protein product [Rotaria magnacalcarata]